MVVHGRGTSPTEWQEGDEMQSKTLPPALQEALLAYLRGERIEVAAVEVMVLGDRAPAALEFAQGPRPQWCARLYLSPRGSL